MAQFTFDDGEVAVAEKGKSVTTEYTVDVSTEPPRLVFAGLFGTNARVPAVYSVNAKTLKICLQPGGIPTEVVTKEGDERLLFTVRRVGNSK